MCSKAVQLLLVPHRFNRNIILGVTNWSLNSNGAVGSISVFSGGKSSNPLPPIMRMSSAPFHSGPKFDYEDYKDEDSGGGDKKDGLRSIAVSGVILAATVYSSFDFKNRFFTVHAAKPIDCERNEYHRLHGDNNNNNNNQQLRLNVAEEGNTLSRRQKFNFIADVVDNAAKAVVCIEVKDHTMIDWFDGTPRTANSGSGFIIDGNGLILTNAHVVNNRGRSSISVQLHDGRKFSGKVEAIDPESDLALISISVKGLPTLRLGNSSETRIGEWVCAIGSPLSLSNSASTGIVSSVKRGASELGIRNDISYIQTDAAITFGNSGGPLVNLDGEAIGINAMKIAAGISFAIPSDHVKTFLAKYESEKKSGSRQIHKRYLGVTLVTLTEDISAQIDKQTINKGVLVWKVVVGSPTYLAGIVPGDIVIKVNSKKIETAKDVYDELKVANTLDTVVMRGNTRFRCTIHPEDISV